LNNNKWKLMTKMKLYGYNQALNKCFEEVEPIITIITTDASPFRALIYISITQTFKHFFRLIPEFPEFSTKKNPNWQILG